MIRLRSTLASLRARLNDALALAGLGLLAYGASWYLGHGAGFIVVGLGLIFVFGFAD
jgi:hypothetical protein